jgi:acetylornithine deacetylase
MLRSLIAVPTVSSLDPRRDQSNRPLLDQLASWMEDAGFRVEQLDIPGAPHKANLLGTLGRGPGGLVLAGHSDTVPCDAPLWQHDPFTLTEDQGRLYGLGTADMKSFLGLALEAARGLDAAELKHPLMVLATADEESSMQGARSLVAAGRPLGRHAIIGEPTGLKPVRAHKGVMGEAIRLTGQSGHASDPSLGNNALEGMHLVVAALLRWRDELKDLRDPAFRIAWPTMSLGHIHGGDAVNRICGQCELHLDMRPLPGQDPAALRAELSERVAAIADARGLGWQVNPLFESVPPASTPASAAILRAAQSLTGHAAETVSFGTEAPFLTQLGMDTIVLGPGDIAQAHQPDEFLALERIEPMLDLLHGLIRRFCLED